MMMIATGPHGVVHALDFAERRRPLPKWMWAAIGVSALLHVAGGIWLYNQNFSLPPAAVSPEAERPPIVLFTPRPQPVETAQAPAAPTPIRRPATPPLAPTVEPSPFAPVEAPVVADSTPVIIPASPTTGTSITPAPVAEPAPAVIRNPTWLSRPSAEQMARYYPARAAEDGVTGSATLLCQVTATGALTGCSVASETPARAGFGQAALRLARYFRMNPRTVGGEPVEGAAVTIPIAFSLG